MSTVEQSSTGGQTCTNCNGSGTAPTQVMGPGGQNVTLMSCRACQGRGKVLDPNVVQPSMTAPPPPAFIVTPAGQKLFPSAVPPMGTPQQDAQAVKDSIQQAYEKALHIYNMKPMPQHLALMARLMRKLWQKTLDNPDDESVKLLVEIKVLLDKYGFDPDKALADEEAVNASAVLGDELRLSDLDTKLRTASARVRNGVVMATMERLHVGVNGSVQGWDVGEGLDGAFDAILSELRSLNRRLSK